MYVYIYINSFIIVLVGSVCGGLVPVVDSEDTPDSSLFINEHYKPIHFTQPIYKATLLENNEISYMDGPILIDNANDGMYFIITSDNYEDYYLQVVDSTVDEQKQIQLESISSNPHRKEFDVIILEALDEDLVPVSRTTILLFNSNKQFDMYKMTFKVDDQEYIILNFFYFKWFLALLTVTGFLILCIELHEIIKNIRVARQSEKYQQLQNV